MGKKLQLIIFLTFLVSPVLFWGQGCPSSVNISADPGTTICDGTSVTFAASVTDGTNLSYQWQINGSNVSSSGSTFSTGSLNNSDKVKVIVTSSDDTNCSTPSNTLTMTVNPNRTGSVEISADNTNICPGDPVNFQISSLTDGGSSPTYEWVLTRNSSSSTVGTSSSYSSSTLEDGDQIQLFITSNIPCVTNNPFSSNTISIVHKDDEPSTPTSITIQGSPSYICPNSSYTFEVNNDATATEYIWNLPDGWSATSTTTTVPSINVTTGSQGGTISTSAKNSCGTSEAQTLAVDVVQKPGTPSQIQVTDENNDGLICPGESLTLSVTNDPEVTSYTWNLPDGWSGTSTSNSIQVSNIDFGENGTASVYSTNQCLDSEVSSISLSVNEPVPGQPGTISGDALVCPGTDAVYSIGTVQYTDSYEWTLDGSIISEVTGTSYTFNSSTAGDYVLQVIAKNECGSSIASSKTITVDDGAPGATSITQSSSDGSSGNTDFCPAETGITFSVPQDARIDTYSWTAPSGWSITAGTGTNEITVTAGQLGNDGQIQFTGSSNDCGSVSATYDVFVKNPAPIIDTESISGEIKVCSNATALSYTIPSIQYADNYVWTAPGNWVIKSGHGTNSIIVDAGSDDGNFTVYAENDCGPTEIVSLAVESIDSAPAQPGTIFSTSEFEADPKICPPLNPLYLAVPYVSDDISYNWILPNGWEIIGDETSNEININVTAGGNYNSTETVQVTATNGCFTSPATTSFAMTISDYIVTDLGDDQTVCSTANQITIPGEIRFGDSKKFNPTYTAINGNGTDVSGNLSGLPTNFNNYPNTFTFSYNATATDKASGSVTVSVQVPPPATSGSDPDACGTGYAEMTIYFKPDPTASISATTEICDGQTAEVTFTATPNSTVTYKIGSGSNQTIQVDDSGSATLTTANLSSDTTYSLVSVQYTAAPNCSKTISGSSTIIVNPVPSVDISYADQCNSESNSATVNYSNDVGAWETGTFSATGDLGANINADGSFIPANVVPGTYTVTYTITGSGGCSDVPVTTDVTIFEEVVITNQPETTRVCEGSDAQFEVTATGEGLSYQWYKGSATAGNEVSNGTSSVLNLTGVSAADAGDYIVVVNGTSPCSPVTSNTAALEVDQDIVLDTQPASITLCENETASLNVAASVGGSPIDNTYSYQWYKGTPGSSSPVSGANSSSLPLNNVVPGDSGDYYVEITGPSDYTCTTTTSAAATVEVRPTPTVEIGGSTSICDGESAEIIFSAGTPNGVVTYIINNNSANPENINLDTNGEAILNTGNLFATSDADTDFIYEIQSVAYPDDPNCSTALSGSATVTVTPNPEVTISFAGNQTEYCTADNTAYTPTLEGTGTFSGGSFSSNGLTIDPVTGEFTPGNELADDYTITYTIPAFGGCPEETTSLDISIYEEVSITSEPSNLGICSTSDAEFSITATGDNLTYQWFKVVGDPDINSGITETDDTPVSGGTSAILSLPVATSEDAGSYYVKVAGTDACTPTEETQIASEVVTLNVDEDIVILEPAEDVRVCDNTNASVEFKFVAHANGAPLTFEWIYADGSSVNPDGTHMVANVIERTDYPGYENITVYEGTLSINSITSADQASYAVRIDGSGNNFNCPEAISNSFNLDVDPLPDEPTVSSVEYCIGDTPEALTATGATGATFTWYDSEGNELAEVPTPSTDTQGDTSYFVTQKDAYCESPKAEIVVTVHDLPAAPPLTAEELNVEYCLGATASALTATASADHTIIWYDSETASTALEEPPIPQTTSAGTVDFWVSQTYTHNTATCESARIQIIVDIKDLPNISIANSGNETICEGDEITLTASDANDSDSSTTYSWDWTDNEGSALAGPAQNFSPSETTTYTVTATSGSGCTNTKDITINVDPQPVAGTLDGPARVCVSDPSGELNLTDSSGTIARWEYKPESSSSWTAITEDTPDANYQFSGLSESTSYRVVVTNGVCDEVFSNEWNILIDPEPVAGELLFKGTDRIFTMCEFPTDDYLVPLQTAGTYIGEIVAWQYRRNSQTDWTTIMDGSEPFTETTLPGSLVNSVSNNESTLFRVEVQSGACSPNVYSDNATLSIVPSDIAPNPVTATPGEICFGEFITLTAGTGYGGYGTFVGGAFDNSSIANHGWRVMRYGNDNNGTEYTFESAADNTRPDRWMRTTPKEFEMANTSGSGTVNQLFDSCSCDDGNKGFAIVSGNNPSTLETPVFNLYATEDPTLTFDQAYNLTSGDIIRVEISLDGGNTYTEAPLMEIIGAEHSGNYDKFGDDGLGEPNNMSIDLSQYAGLGNLRIRWLYDGSTGGIYTIDDIGLPEDPQNVQLIWYYDDDLNDPNNDLEPIGEVNQGTVNYTPTKIGWNYFQVNTALVFDTNGDPCESAENMATIQVYVYDSYTTTASADVGVCGNTEVPLTGTLTGGQQGEIAQFPVDDLSTIAWTVLESPDGYEFSESHFTPSVSDPNAVFTPPVEGNYTISWAITPDEKNTCIINNGEVSFYFAECTTLDFDGVDDHVVIQDSYSGAQTIEAWVRPESENGPGSGKVATIFSTENYELFLNASGKPVLKYYGKTLTSNKTLSFDGRWYHLAAVFDSGSASLFIDGIEITDKTTGTGNTTGTGDKFLIGARYNGDSTAPDNYFSGWIEELRIWNTQLNQDQIRFMMNQHLQNAGNMGVEIPMPVPGGLNYNNLLGYYRLISSEPDPLGAASPITYDPALMPLNGQTPDLATTSIPGTLRNMTTHQQNTAPLPYLSANDGQWINVNTWLRPAVWDIPNANGVTGAPIEWNIVRTFHDITSQAKDITVLGLKSETVGKELTIANPSGPQDETNSGQFIRVTHYLWLDGNMDLVGESQLLQDEGSILEENSVGWLERDQQGRLSSFNYNYWTSPVSVQGSANNSGYILNSVLLDGTNSQNPQPVNFNLWEFAADGAKTSPITISSYWIWDFRGGEADIYGDWTHLGEDGTGLTGSGYSMKGTDGTVAPNTSTQNYVYRGKPHNANIQLSIGQNQNYLVGNPYPSSIDSWEFLLDNLTGVQAPDGTPSRGTSNVFNGTLYYWDHFSGSTHLLEEYIGGYATFNFSGTAPAISNDWRINETGGTGVKEPKRFIPVAQGFFLNSATESGQTFSGTITFKNSQRVYKRENNGDPSIFLIHEDRFKSSQTTSTRISEDERAKIRLKFESPAGYHRQILVTRDPNTTNNFDLGYDAPLIENNVEDMYWLVNENPYVIQAVPDFEKDQVLQLAIKTRAEGQFTIKIDSTENWPAEKQLYLKDKKLDTIHNILEADYVGTSDSGEIKDRFELVFFKEAQDPSTIPDLDDSDLPVIDGLVGISYSHFSRQIKISNDDLLEVSKVMVFDMNGKLIQEFDGFPTEKEILLGMRPVRSGVYIVKVLSENAVTDKKIVIK